MHRQQRNRSRDASTLGVNTLSIVILRDKTMVSFAIAKFNADLTMHLQNRLL